MTPFFIALLTLAVLILLALAASVVAACMLSSQISRERGEDEYSQFIHSQKEKNR